MKTYYTLIICIIVFSFSFNSKEVNNENTLVKDKSNNYTFVFEGTEPFWKLKYDNDSITINMYDDTIVKKEVFFSEKSINGNTIGFQNDIISGIINETWGEPCLFAITENDSLNYEIYFIYKNKTYKGCGDIQKIK